MQGPVSVLRGRLKDDLDRVVAGDEVIVTDRGIPVARLVPVDSRPTSGGSWPRVRSAGAQRTPWSPAAWCSSRPG